MPLIGTVPHKTDSDLERDVLALQQKLVDEHGQPGEIAEGRHSASARSLISALRMRDKDSNPLEWGLRREDMCLLSVFSLTETADLA